MTPTAEDFARVERLLARCLPRLIVDGLVADAAALDAVLAAARERMLTEEETQAIHEMRDDPADTLEEMRNDVDRLLEIIERLAAPGGTA